MFAYLPLKCRDDVELDVHCQRYILFTIAYFSVIVDILLYIEYPMLMATIIHVNLIYDWIII